MGFGGPLTFTQESIWHFERAFSGTTVQQVGICLELQGTESAQQLSAALQAAIERRPILRGKPEVQEGSLQMVRSTAPVAIQDISSTPDPAAADPVEAFKNLPFDLEAGPLLRAARVQAAGGSTQLVLVAHRIVADWHLLSAVGAEVMSSLRAGAIAPVSSAADVFPDMAQRQRQWAATPDFQSDRDWWKQQLRAPVPVLQLPALARRSSGRTFAAGSVNHAVPAELVARMLAHPQAQNQQGLEALLLAAFAALLARYSAQDDFVLGWSVQVEGGAASAAAAMPRKNWLPLRVQVDGEQTFDALRLRLAEQAASAWQHRNLPFDVMLRDLALPPRSSVPPLIQALFEWRETTGAHASAMSELPLRDSPFDVRLVATRKPDAGGAAEGIELSLRYNTELLNAGRASALMGHLCELLSAGLAAPATPVNRLPLMGAGELRQITEGFNQTRADYPGHRCLHDLVSEQAARTPQATAYIFEGRRCTYAEVDRWSDAMAARLQSLGIGKGHFVPLLMDRSLELPVCMLGVMKAGAAYVPMDIHWPAQRAQLIITDTGSPVVLVTDAAALAEHVPAGVQAVQVAVDGMTEPRELQKSAQRPALTSDDPIYMIYTSGSTGMPKGAINKHRGIVNRLSYMTRKYGCAPHDVILQTSAHIFDASVWQYFWPLINGATSVLPSPMTGFDHRHVTELVGRYGVTVTDFVPSVFNIMVDILEQDAELRQRLSTLRQILIGGEALSPKAVFRFLQRYPKANITNTYGPTETSIGCIFYEVTRTFEEPLPIGKPIGNVNAYILDNQLQPLPIGVPGNLFVGGECVGLGYHRDPAKTAAVFLDNPFPHIHPGRIYKTGDLARFKETGDIEFLGRADHQVKIRGVRVELGEIEGKLAQHPGVSGAVVNLYEAADGSKRLAAYLVPAEGADPSTEELRAFMRQTLPEYLIPNVFVRLAELPLLRSGKVDRKSLQPPTEDTERTRAVGTPPTTKVQLALAKAWEEEIGMSGVSIHDNFFELGGDSLAAMKVLARLEMEHGIRLEAEQMMNQSLGQLAAGVPGQGEADASAAPAAAAAEAGTAAAAALEPFFFGPAGRQLFGCLHPAATQARAAVVVCPPMGHEYLFTHRSLRHLAQMLSAGSQAVLRMDYFGCGDSQGDAAQITLPGCAADVQAALAETRRRLPGAAPALIGLRLGAVVATLAAVTTPAVQRVVLWDPVTDGAGHLAALAAVHLRISGNPAVRKPGADYFELAGFPMPLALHGQIETLGWEPYAALKGKQVLLIDSSADGQQDPFAAWLKEQGVDVELAHIAYPEIWNQDPYKTRLPTKILDEVCRWLAGASA